MTDENSPSVLLFRLRAHAEAVTVLREKTSHAIIERDAALLAAHANHDVPMKALEEATGLSTAAVQKILAQHQAPKRPKRLPERRAAK
jgi:hypothetical protein